MRESEAMIDSFVRATYPNGTERQKHIAEDRAMQVNQAIDADLAQADRAMRGIKA